MSQIRIFDHYQNIIFHTSSGLFSGKNIRDFLSDLGIHTEAPCGSHGSCGKCMVGLQTGSGPLVMVQSCQSLLPSEDCNIYLPSNVQIVKNEPERRLATAEDVIETGTCGSGSDLESRPGLGAAVDLGTTTVVVSLIDLTTGSLLGRSSDWNCQNRYGADVISRAQYCSERSGGLRTLSSAIRRQIRRMIGMLADECGRSFSQVKEMAVAGNTIMQHIFAAIDPAPITVAPYQPSTRFSEKRSYAFPEFPGILIYLFPCVAGYVGGDITSGLFAAEELLQEGLSLFLDIGTNGEMALGNRSGLISCSVASGPAFEGANISCGMRSMEGAVNHVSVNPACSSDPLLYQVIGGGEPKGLCGSGLLDLTALLLQHGVIDETGRMLGPGEINSILKRFVSEDENENGCFHIASPDSKLCLTAGDVRQLQLAKAAVAAGIQTLLHRAGKSLSDVDHVYLAGGFGRHLKPESVCALGMIPGQWQDKLLPLGNSSLAGAEKLLKKPNAFSQVQAVQASCEYIELSLDAGFSDAFIDAMYF